MKDKEPDINYIKFPKRKAIFDPQFDYIHMSQTDFEILIPKMIQHYDNDGHKESKGFELNCNLRECHFRAPCKIINKYKMPLIFGITAGNKDKTTRIDLNLHNYLIPGD